MKFISWNVNGLRACIGKGFWDFFKNTDSDFFCVQEIKMQRDRISTCQVPGYKLFYNCAEKKGYSGTAIFTKHEPISVTYDMGPSEHRHEGRVITLEMEKFYLVNCYTPNSKEKLLRLDYRMEWEDDFREYIKLLDKAKPVILCGDLNVAHKEIDLKNPKTNRRNAGFTDEERGKMSELLRSGFMDIYRELYPNEKGYTWWSYRFSARAKNIGWRIDYFLASERFRTIIKNVVIHSGVLGSDHCPVELLIGEN